MAPTKTLEVYGDIDPSLFRSSLREVANKTLHQMRIPAFLGHGERMDCHHACLSPQAVVAMELKYLSVVEQVFLSPVKISSFMLSQLNNVNFHQ
eukprot:m.235009 g.235009  ORF g.235009 m.235009 type:complete len:94 (-) comp16039_c0_seq1:4003-4284(-)